MRRQRDAFVKTVLALTIAYGACFIVYALFARCNLSIHVMWGLKQQNTVLAVGKSIFNKTSGIDVGRLTLGYGGGGHANAGTCQVPNEKADGVLEDILRKINAAELQARTVEAPISHRT